MMAAVVVVVPNEASQSSPETQPQERPEIREAWPPPGDKPDRIAPGNLECMRLAEEEFGAGAALENRVAEGLGSCYDLTCCCCAGMGCGANMATVNQGETGVVTKWGRVYRSLPPGRHRFNICTEQVYNVNLMQTCITLGREYMMTSDNLGVAVDAVTYFVVVDARRASFLVEDYQFSLRQLVACMIRTVVGEHTLAEVLSERQKMSARITDLLANSTTEWGVKVNRVEMKQIDMDAAMQRALAAKSEASQQAEAKLIQAQATRDAALILAEAGRTMAEHPAAMQLQWFETMRLISTQGKNVTLVVSDTVETPEQQHM